MDQWHRDDEAVPLVFTFSEDEEAVRADFRKDFSPRVRQARDGPENASMREIFRQAEFWRIVYEPEIPKEQSRFPFRILIEAHAIPFDVGRDDLKDENGRHVLPSVENHGPTRLHQIFEIGCLRVFRPAVIR